MTTTYQKMSSKWQLILTFGRETLRGDPPPPDLLCRVWSSVRNEFLNDWIRDKPGTRPFAWWVCEGVPKYGERPRLGEPDERIEQCYVRCGILHTKLVGDWQDGLGIRNYQEPEETFLDRHGLLTDSERALLQEQS